MATKAKAVPAAIQALQEEEEETLYSDDFDMDAEDEEGQEDEMLIVDDGSSNTAETNKFDAIVGALEEAILDEGFEQAREDFCRQNCHHFEDSDENKLVYTELFERYCTLLESSLDAALSAAVPGFDMGEFIGMVEERQDELASEVFDLLLSMADFGAFKELMLSYKQQAAESADAAGATSSSGVGAMQVSCHAAAVHREEQEDGEERPDLDGMSLTVSPLVSPVARAAGAAGAAGLVLAR